MATTNLRRKCWTNEEILEALQDGSVSDVEIDEEEDELQSELVEYENAVQRAEQLNEDQQEIEDIFQQEIETAQVELIGEEEQIVFTEKSDIKWSDVVEEIEHLGYDNNFCLEDTVDYNTVSPLQYFINYIPEDFIDEISEKTNIYALQKGVLGYKMCSNTEIRKLIGLHLLMGILKFPRVRMYWDSLLGINVFSQAMTVNRFFQLRNNLHFIDNNTIPNDNLDKFIKVRPLINRVLSHCRKIPMEKEVCVDEQMIPFKGKLVMKQYIRGKPSPWGLKNFVLCGQSGIVHNFILYQGKSTEINDNLQKQFGLGGGVVLSLIGSVKEGQHLFMDNFFTNYHLMQELQRRKINAYGTAIQNRYGGIKNEMPDATLKKKPRGHIDQRQSQNKIIFLKWTDNKIVNMVSNSVGKGIPTIVKRWCNKTKQHVQIPCPEVICKYNKGKGGVDKIDFLIALYRSFIKSKKWPLRVFTHFLDLSVTNAWLEYIRDMGLARVPVKDRLDLLHFRLYVAKALIGTGTSTTRKRGRPSSTESSPAISPRSSRESTPIRDIRFDGYGHLPDVDDKPAASRCKNPLCSSKTHFFCTKCNVHLCVSKKNKCFKDYHTK